MSDLKDLLGSDDEDEEVVNDIVPKTDKDELNEQEFASENVKEEIPTQSKNADLSHLLGESDDEDEMDIDDVKFSSSQLKENELDKIFGGAVSDNTTDQPRTRSKIKSQLNLPRAFKIQPNRKSIFLRMPNFVKIQPNPYENSYYNAEDEKKEFDAATTSVIRYRINKNKIESNARVLQWSDGSQQLVVGDAVFEMKVVPTDNCYIFQQQLTKQINDEDESEIQKFHLECNGNVESRIILQPTSLDSDIHTRMTLKITEKNKREKKISIRDYETILEAPEKTLQKLIKQEEEDLRKLRKQREQNSEGRSFMINTAPRRGPAMTADYLNDYEAEEPEEETKPAVKSKGKSKPAKSRERRGDDEAEDDDDENDEREVFSADGSDDGESLGAEDSYSENSEEEEEVVEDDEEEEEAVEDDEEDEESVEGEEDSGDENKKSKKKDKGGDVSSKKDKKKIKKEKKEKKEKKHKKEKTKRKRDDDIDEEDIDDSGPLNTSTAAELLEDDEEGLNIPQRKKAKKAFVDSDEEEL